MVMALVVRNANATNASRCVIWNLDKPDPPTSDNPHRPKMKFKKGRVFEAEFRYTKFLGQRGGL